MSTVDALDRELRALRAERVAAPPPPPRRVQGLTWQQYASERRLSTVSTGSTHRGVDSMDRDEVDTLTPDTRLAEARRDGIHDSWWEEQVPDA